MLNVLVLTEDYPNNEGGLACSFVHARNVYYKTCGIDVTVLSFRASENYEYDGVKVITGKHFCEKRGEYELAILHAANLRHHLLFLMRFGNRFKKYIFFFHGHEVLDIEQVYSKPYDFVGNRVIKKYLNILYGKLKLSVWRHYVPYVAHKSYFVFVSTWMENEFYRWTKIPCKLIQDRSLVIYNCVGNIFEHNVYNANKKKEYDFITIRSVLDESKYAVDIVNRIAWNTPECRFVLFGKGRIFNYFDKAPNLEWHDKSLSHKEIVELLDKSRYALMPTRTDAQGVMMCEMAAFGIPVITSDIKVCHEVFGAFENVEYINNDDTELSLKKYKDIAPKCVKHEAYYKENTVKREVEFIYKINGERD